MKRRTLDIFFAVGGLAIAVMLAVLGVVMSSNARFANNYVHDQLIQQNISFKAAADLTEEEAAAPCLVAYAGQKLTSGKQAECYANNFIGLHVKSIADGKTYADLGGVQNELKAKIATAEAAKDPGLAALNGQLAAVTGQRESLFKGETLRGLLLTSYGFSSFGTKAGQVANVAYAAAAVLMVLSIAGLAHAARTAGTVAFAEPDHLPARRTKRVATA
jgi:hypothetical protein